MVLVGFGSLGLLLPSSSSPPPPPSWRSAGEWTFTFTVSGGILEVQDAPYLGVHLALGEGSDFSPVLVKESLLVPSLG